MGTRVGLFLGALTREVGSLPVYVQAQDVWAVPEHQRILNWPETPPRRPPRMAEAAWLSQGEDTGAAAASTGEPREVRAAASCVVGQPTGGRLPEGGPSLVSLLSSLSGAGSSSVAEGERRSVN